jgi:hypothetical protein
VTAPALPWASLAGKALHHAIQQRTDISYRCINRIAAVYGPEVLPQVLLAWLDTTIGQLWPDGPPDPEKFGGLVFLDANRNRMQEADETPSGIRWAGRLLTARLLDDEDQALALLHSLHGREREWAEAVAGVLNICATAIRIRRLAVGGG